MCALVVAVTIGLCNDDGNYLVGVNFRDSHVSNVSEDGVVFILGSAVCTLVVVAVTMGLCNDDGNYLVGVNFRDSHGFTVAERDVTDENQEIMQEISSHSRLTGTVLQRDSLFSNVFEHSVVFTLESAVCAW